MSQQNEIGTLVVVVLKAQHLHQPSFYKQDPYGQASLGGLKKRTKTAPKGGQHPVWDEELRFPVLADVGKDKANRILEVACYKEVQRGEDVLLGKGTVDIEETLTTGEFDDWVPLETAAGARGEVYLEMTFYANSPPPVTRRPSKLSPSDRLAHPAQGGHLPPTTPPAVSPQPGHSPIAAERKLSQPPPGSGNQIPASLIPALGPKSQGPRQTLPGTPVTTIKHRKDSLPPLPADDISDVGPEKNPGFPVALQPGARSGPRPMPPQNRNRVTSIDRSPPELLPGQPSRKSLSDTPALRAVPPFALAQAPTQLYSPETTPAAGQWPGLTPTIVVEEHPSLTSSAPLSSPLGPPQAYTQQAFIPAPAQDFSRTLSPFQSQPHYDVPLPHYQQYTQYLSRHTTPQPLPPSQTYPQLHNTQPGQQQPSPPHSSQQPPYPLQPQHHPPYQQPYVPPPQQQYHSQHLPYIQTPHPTQVQQPYEQHNLPTPPSSNQPVATQQSLHPQTQQSYLIPPPPPQVQSPTPQTHTQPYFSPPPPPPPPPPLLNNQDRKGSSIPPPVVQALQTPKSLPVPSQGLIPSTTSLQQTITPAAPTLQSSATPSHSRVTQDSAPPALADTQVILGQNRTEERRSEAEYVSIAATGVMTREARGAREDAGRHWITHEQNENVVREEQRQVDTPKLAEEQGVEEERDTGQRVEKERRREEEQQEGELKLRGEEQLKQREMERKGEEEEHIGEGELQEQGELRKKEEECKRMEEDERRRRAEEELRKNNEEECRQREEERTRREEERRRMEEERNRREEECRRKEEERERREEEERRRREDERRRQEEERIRREREEAERRRKIAEEEARRRRAEEAEAERRWEEEVARIRARAEQEATDAAFARAQMEADEAERQRQEEADLAFLRRAQEEVDREEIVARERTRQVEADMEVARREQAHEEELERRRQEEADRELARRLDMELNLGAESSSDGGDWSRRRRAAGARGNKTAR